MSQYGSKRRTDDTALDFEAVSVAAARVVAHEPPPGVRERFENNPRGWETVRRNTRSSDLRLDDEALRWIAHLPEPLRPHRTAKLYPRVVNGLARRWSKPYERLSAVEMLLIDTRRGRQGFPQDVRAELEHLRKALIRAARVDDVPTVIEPA